ncbi:TIGR03885 family FMN-dependent LLM class oxidoreductase [Agrococcus sp. ARC_14]|uniref:TIGR03885 family FMN-dependent LLM class oxidoreductase n=1 Tax=Agrococcus sp. ARC_14 TaxID=2919927 RepID=UPI001F069D53|nr:TIGR03885 family FMN-dependent LLM class oxidoreductase [Agrococcus sp. ARC_14]MCH1881535.1 TIGR03885 family FMN-dependent LLM class oxidoreductase [Agrococcus sp. ARC_14]
MAIIGFHASHEQIPPSALLQHVQHAEQAGFAAAMCSDHLAPWSLRQGHSGHSWAWLGAALASTSLPFGVVTAPGQRAHPAVVAQAIATLGEMFPGRFWAALGSGENVNEHVTGEPWPDKATRERRLIESADVMRRLLAGEEVSHSGEIVVDGARVWSRPPEPPPLIGAAVSPVSAASHARWADGLITVAADGPALRDVLTAYRDAGGRGPVSAQLHLSWAPDERDALAIALDQWAYGTLGPPATWDIATPAEFDRRSVDVDEEAIRRAVTISSDLAVHVARVAEILDAGYDAVYLHHVGQEQSAFIDAFGERVLPALDRTLPGTTAAGDA